jgi:hypothetical protein
MLLFCGSVDAYGLISSYKVIFRLYHDAIPAAYFGSKSGSVRDQGFGIALRCLQPVPPKRAALCPGRGLKPAWCRCRAAPTNQRWLQRSFAPPPALASPRTHRNLVGRSTSPPAPSGTRLLRPSIPIGFVLFGLFIHRPDWLITKRNADAAILLISAISECTIRSTGARTEDLVPAGRRTAEPPRMPIKEKIPITFFSWSMSSPTLCRIIRGANWSPSVSTIRLLSASAVSRADLESRDVAMDNPFGRPEPT